MPGSISINDEVGDKTIKKELTEIFDKDGEEYKKAKPVDSDLLGKVWKELAFEVSKDHPDLGSTLAAGLPVIGEEFTLQFEVKNAIQKDKLDAQRTELVPVIRERLGNRFINLNVVVNPDKFDDRKPATPVEKFTLLAEKNPVVKDLQKKFGLEPNY